MTQKIAVAGASGRMGQMLIDAIRASDDCTLAGALDISGNPSVGLDAGALSGKPTGVLITSDLHIGLKPCDVLIDFTRPEGTLAHLKVCRELGVSAVIGTTGFTDGQKAEIAAIAQDIAIVMAPNMSVGVNVTLKLLEMAAKALSTGEGVTGERDPSSIGFATIRGGDIVGDHTVLFAGIGERIEISHKSSSRVTYAQGSLRAAAFLSGKKTGLFDMFDVLSLR